MSKTSYILIGIMVAAIAFMAALRGYRAYEAHVAQQEADRVSVFTFQNVPLRLGPGAAEAVSRPVRLPHEQQDVFLEEGVLSAEKQTEQAAQTISSILSDYEQNDALVQFNQELSAVTAGKVKSLTDLSGPELAGALQQYPQIGQVIQKNLQDPKFASVVKDIFTNPQFAASIAVLQGAAKQPVSLKN